MRDLMVVAEVGVGGNERAVKPDIESRVAEGNRGFGKSSLCQLSRGRVKKGRNSQFIRPPV
jgi:hypothetical protein